MELGCGHFGPGLRCLKFRSNLIDSSLAEFVGLLLRCDQTFEGAVDALKLELLVDSFAGRSLIAPAEPQL